MFRSRFRAPCSFLVACALLAIARAPAQDLVFSTAVDVAASNGFALRNELHRFGASGRRVELPVELLNLYVGDSDVDGAFDDGPTDIDAAHWTGTSGCDAFLLSTTVGFTAAGGLAVLDGDVFRFTATGVEVVYPESMFATAAGATGVDVDAFAIGDSGEIYFSFAEDETTTIPSLIAANGGQSLIDEQCVFRIDPGATFATLHFTQAQVVGFFNSACGTTTTSVVDVQGIALDPFNPGALLLTSASTATAIRGRVITTFGGGQIFSVNGTTVEPSNLDFAAPVALDALAVVYHPAVPVVRTPQQVFSVNTTGTGSVEATGFLPGEIVRFLVTDAVGVRPAFVGVPGFAGFPQTPLDLTSPVLYQSFAAPEFLATADAFGSAHMSFALAGLPPYVVAVVQAVGFVGFAVSTPSVLSFLP